MSIKINHEQLERVIETSYERGTALFIEGGIGIGKSQTCWKVAQDIAKSKDKNLIDWNRISEEEKRTFIDKKLLSKSFIFADIRASEIDMSDIKLPSFNNGFIEYKLPLLFKVLSIPEADGFILFDELNLAVPSVLSSLYKIILDRVIGDLALSQNVGIVACGNRQEDRTGIYDLPMALANRFIHVELEPPSKDKWIDWALKNGIETDICMFIEQHPNMLHMFEKTNKSKAYPTPRTWAFTSRLIKDHQGNLEDYEILVASAIGEGVSHAFVTFSKLKRKIDIENLLNHPESAKNITELDLKHSLIATLSERYRSDKGASVEKILHVCSYMESEFAILLLRYLKTIGGTEIYEQVKDLKIFNELTRRYNKLLCDMFAQ